jgi:hypothetical protein
MKNIVVQLARRGIFDPAVAHIAARLGTGRSVNSDRRR